MADFNRMPGTPPFSMDKPKFDMNTFKGRLFTILNHFDPRTWLFVGGAKISRSQELLNDYAKTQRLPAGTTDEDMWKARRIVEDAIHPVTKQRKCFLGRGSAFVITKFPIFFFLINSSTAPAMVYWNVIREIYNHGIAYVNSPPSVDWCTLMMTLFLGVTSSCGISVGALKALQLVPALQSLEVGITYFAVSSALACIALYKRADEWCGGGISLISAEDRELGKSLKAGRKAILRTVCTCAFVYPIPSFLVPAVVMKATSAVPMSGVARMMAEVILVLFCTSFGLSCAIASSPTHQGKFSTGGLEPKFQSLTDSSGKPITKVFTKPGWLGM